MLVKDVMSKKLTTVSPDDTLIDLIEKMMKCNFHMFPVIDDTKKVVGSVNFNDIMKIFTPHNPSLEKLLKSTHLYNVKEDDLLEFDFTAEQATDVRVAEIMETNVVTIGGDEYIPDARKLMKQHNTKKLLVVTDGKLCGLITLFDIIVAVMRRKGVIS